MVNLIKKTKSRLDKEIKWINKQKEIIDYIEIANRFGIGKDTAREDIIKMIRYGYINSEKILCKIEGKNFLDEDIIRVFRKNKQWGGRKYKD